MKDETVLTYMNWNKKESTYIKICLQIQKRKLHQLSLSLKKKKKKQLWLKLYLDFGFRGFVNYLRRDFPLFFLGSPSHEQNS